MAKRLTVSDLQRMRDQGQAIPVITAYDYPSARLADEAGIPVLLVGDTLGMVVLGYDSTLPVTVEDMIHHGKAVVRGSKAAHVVVDMPFGSYQASSEDALRNGMRIVRETGCGSVKLEGGRRSADTVRRLVEAGVPVMGHVGLTPQSVNATGGFKLQGKTEQAQRELLEDARALEQAGAYAIVLELVPEELAKTITQTVNVPTIGIGAGVTTSGQVQVMHDILGLFDGFVPRHTRRFDSIGERTRAAFLAYREAVTERSFPGPAETFSLEARRPKVRAV